MDPRRGSPVQVLLYWFARLPLVWALLAGFGVSALLADTAWYVRVFVIGIVSVVILGLGYLARAHLLAQMRTGAPPPPVSDQAPPPPTRRRQIRRRRDR